jgi:hypothetical protein
MAKCILFTGQSLGKAMCLLSSSTLTAHADTHMWNGSGWSAPVGDGAIMYANCLREALQEHIYLINACVDGSPLLPYGSIDYWSDPTGPLVCDAIAQTQAALASVSGLELDRIEWWQGQTEGLAGGYSNMGASYYAGLETLLETLRTGLGEDFRLAIWPVGKVGYGTTGDVLRAQLVFSTGTSACALGVEPGPASYDRAYATGSPLEPTHLLNAGEYACMGIRGARNAMSYFVAKANNALTIPHHGAGPQITEIIRHPALNRMLVVPTVKAGFRILARNIWEDVDPNTVTGFRLSWGVGTWDALNVTGAQVCGGYIRVFSDGVLQHPVSIGYQDNPPTCDSQFAVYDSHDRWIGGYGQPMLPHALGMSVSS